MADNGIMVQAHVDPDSELGEQWKKHSESFDNGSEALRDLMRDCFDDDDDVAESSPDVTRGVRAGLATLLILFLGQAHLVYGPRVSMPLVAVALLAFAIVLVAPMSWSDVLSGGAHE